MHIFKSVGYRKLANICKPIQICKPVVPNFFFKCLSIFLVKWVYHNLYIFQFQFFLYKLTHLNTQTYSRNLHTHTYSRNWHTHTYSRNWHTQTYSRHICTHAYSTNWHTFTYSIIWHNRTYILHKSTYWYILQKLTYSYKRRTYIVQKLAYPYILQKQDSTHEMTYLGYLPAQLLYCTLCTVYMYIKLTFKGGAERHDNHPDEEVGHGQGGDQVVGGRVQAPLLHHSL